MSGPVNVDLLERLSPSLLKLIEPDFGLIHELYLRKVLADSERQSVQAKASVFDRNKHLMSFLKRKSPDQGRDFLLALDNTDQMHIANWIENPRSEFSLC